MAQSKREGDAEEFTAAGGTDLTILTRTMPGLLQISRRMLAYCNMRTLYLRNVPDEVVHRLETLASREGLSVSAMAVRELASSTCRADNPALLGDLPDLRISTADILAALHEGRAER